MSPTNTNVDFTTFRNVINGQLRGSPSSYNGIDPCTEEELWHVPVAQAKDVEDAIASANAAWPAWSSTTIEERRHLLAQYTRLCETYASQLTNLLIKEAGKPRKAAEHEVRTITTFSDHHLKLEIPETTDEDDEKIITTRYVPIGVVAAICPWNYPITLAIGKILPGLLTGNCVIVKPSPFTPYTALKLVELGRSIFPPGVLQVLGGDDNLGPALVAHSGIHKISFTGSVATGKRVMQAASATLKRVTLELGGNDACIVLPDVDIDTAAPQVVLGAFRNSGQMCAATKRIYIHESIYQPFLKKMVEFTQQLKVGRPDDDEVALGPIQNAMQYQRVKELFTDSEEKGYKLSIRGSTVMETTGYFVQPNIVDNPPSESRVVQEEAFGPIVPTQPWSDEDKVIKRANDTTAGLAACIWSTDVAHAERIGRRLQAGSIFINSSPKPTPKAIFGGHKESGIGVEWGSTGLLSFCNPQVFHTYKTL